MQRNNFSLNQPAFYKNMIIFVPDKIKNVWNDAIQQNRR